jgi:FkbH-like protein
MTDMMATPGKQPAAADGALRDRILALLAAGQRDAAIQAGRTLLGEQPGVRSLRFLRKTAESEAARQAGLKAYKVALLSSFSIEFLHDALIAYGFVNGLRLQLYQAGFGSFRQEMLDHASGLYAWSPDAVVLAVEGEDWVPAAYGGVPRHAEQDSAALVDGFRSEIGALIGAFRSRSKAQLLIHNLALPVWRRLGILDAHSPAGQALLVNRLNDALHSAAEGAVDVHVVDYAALTSRYGARQWYDPRMRLYAGAPIAQPMLPHLAREHVKFIRCFVGFNKKCLVLDLDNTLWGGVLGEEGVDGIHLGPTYPGSAFVEFQRHVLALRQRGVILAIASKNNAADVDEVLARHRFMVLRKEHFSDAQVHWDLKSESLRRIAATLGIGLEHVVLADDNPAECEQVRGALPMVTVIQLPPQPERYVEALYEDGWFDALAISSEDARRGELYQQRADSEALRSSSVSLEDYYRALDMEFRVAPVDRASLKRAAQLTQKTNQFTVTTRRYSEAQLTELMSRAEWSLVTVGVTDRFGDNGIVGVMMARVVDGALDIDTFLLSCRLIGRTVETGMLAYLCDLAEHRGLKALTGQLVPTEKNCPVRGLFEQHGFSRIAEDASGGTVWRISLPGQRVPWPEWFRVVRGGV